MTTPLAALVLAGYNARPGSDGSAVAAATERTGAFDRFQDWMFSHVFYSGGEFVKGYKAVKKIAGRPMVQYVIDAANGFMGGKGKVYVIGDVQKLDDADVRDCAKVPQGFTFGENVILGLDRIREDYGSKDVKVTVLTCDIPKITRETVEDVVDNFKDDADFGLALMSKEIYKGHDEYKWRIRKPKYFMRLAEGKYRIVNAAMIHLNGRSREIIRQEAEYIRQRRTDPETMNDVLSNLKTAGMRTPHNAHLVNRIDSVYANRRMFWFPNAVRMSYLAGNDRKGKSYLPRLFWSQYRLASPISYTEIEEVSSRVMGMRGKTILVSKPAAEQDADWQSEFDVIANEIRIAQKKKAKQKRKERRKQRGRK